MLLFLLRTWMQPTMQWITEGAMVAKGTTRDIYVCKDNSSRSDVPKPIWPTVPFSEKKKNAKCPPGNLPGERTNRKIQWRVFIVLPTSYNIIKKDIVVNKTPWSLKLFYIYMGEADFLLLHQPSSLYLRCLLPLVKYNYWDLCWCTILTFVYYTPLHVVTIRHLSLSTSQSSN